MNDTTERATAAPAVDPADVDAAGETARAVVENVQRVIVGNDEAIEHLVTALLGGGHVLLEDVGGPDLEEGQEVEFEIEEAEKGPRATNLVRA